MAPLHAAITAAALAGTAHAQGSEGVRAEQAPSPVALDLELVSSLFEGSAAQFNALRHRERVRGRARRRALPLREYRVFAATQVGPFDIAIAREARTWGLDPFLLKGLLENESRLDPKLTGKRMYAMVDGKRRTVGGGARGIAQFTGSGIAAVNETRQRRHLRGEHVELFTEVDVWNVERSIAAAAELLASYMARFGRDGGITAYNSGPYGGRLVAEHGFDHARRSGRLSRVGHTRLQGHRFLLNVLRKSNRLRRASGLSALRGPLRRKRPSKRALDKLARRGKRRPNS